MMSREFHEDIVDRAVKIAEQKRKELQQSSGGAAYGHRRPDDLEFLVWFEGFARENPNWPRALLFADGGKETLDRYAKLTEFGTWRFHPDNLNRET